VEFLHEVAQRLDATKREVSAQIQLHLAALAHKNTFMECKFREREAEIHRMEREFQNEIYVKLQ
jgi:hypothetical protein